MVSPRVTYDSNRARWAFYSDSYWGGEFYRNPSCPTLGRAQLWGRYKTDTGQVELRSLGAADSYLVPYPGESLEEFGARHSLSVYVNVCAPIVDSYVESTTGGVVRQLPPALKGALGNLDGQGSGWEDHVAEVARASATYGFCAVVLDLPRENPAQNAEQESQLGIGYRATLVTPPAIAWVEHDEHGATTELAFVEQAWIASGASDAGKLLAGPTAPQGEATTVTLWVYDRMEWRQYTLSTRAGADLGSLRASLATGGPGGVAIEPARRGHHLGTPLGKCPVAWCYFRRHTEHRAPFGVSLLADIADLGRAVYNKLSGVDHVHLKTAFPFLAIPTTNRAGVLEAETEVTVGPDKALGFPAESGAPQWVQPTAEQTQELRTHAVFLVVMAYRLAGIEVSTEGTSGVDSGLAIQLKSQGFERMARKFAGYLASYETTALELVAEAAQQPPPAPPTYPARFVLPDSSEDLARAVLVWQVLGSDLPLEGKLATLRQALVAALNLPAATVDKVVAAARAELAPAPAPAPAPMVRPPLGGPPPAPPANRAPPAGPPPKQ